MDQYLSTVIIALITGIFSIITLVIQKKQDKVINKIDEQTMFIEKEKGLKQQLTQKEKERDEIIHDITILILETNMAILTNDQQENNNLINAEVFAKSSDLKKRYSKIIEEINDITREYNIVLEMTSQFHNDNPS